MLSSEIVIRPVTIMIINCSITTGKQRSIGRIFVLELMISGRCIHTSAHRMVILR